MCYFTNFEVQLYFVKVLNKPNKCCSHILYKMLQSFAKTRYPSLLFRPIRLKICRVWVCARDLEWKSLCVRKRHLKGIEKKGLPEMHRNGTNHTLTHTHASFLSLSSLFFPLAFSLWTADRQGNTYSKTKRQTIDYIRYSCNKNPLCSQGIVHTRTDT